MAKIIAIALNTFKEAVRNKVLYFLLIFAIFMMGFSSVISSLSIAYPQNTIKTLGLASIDFIGFLIAVFVGVYLVYGEIDKRSIYTIVSKPIGRNQYVLGKFFGLLFTIFVNVVIMTFFFFVVIYYREATDNDVMVKALYKAGPDGKMMQVMSESAYYFQSVLFSCGKALGTIIGVYHSTSTAGCMAAIIMTMFGLSIMTAVAILFSTVSTPTLSAVFTFLTWIISMANEDIARYAMKLETDSINNGGWVAAERFKYLFAMFWTHALPNLGFFNIRSAVVYGSGEAAVAGAMVGPAVVDWYIVFYGVAYTAGLLAVACMIFNRRSFK